MDRVRTDDLRTIVAGYLKLSEVHNHKLPLYLEFTLQYFGTITCHSTLEFFSSS